MKLALNYANERLYEQTTSTLTEKFFFIQVEIRYTVSSKKKKCCKDGKRAINERKIFILREF